MTKKFEKQAMFKENPKWRQAISRMEEMYNPIYGDAPMRSEFDRDYTRIINCKGYRRLKHKTQVFFSPKNDHICTRIEHVNLVESISNTVANYLGLNSELTKAIAVAHDIGHSPFGHQGEKILSQIAQREYGKKFWHGYNGLNCVDNLELLSDVAGIKRNLNLTYAVRDGIPGHCGTPTVTGQKPREEVIDLKNFTTSGKYAPFTWEGCVVKIADKIAYLGRDIEDAISLGILDENLEELYNILQSKQVINNTVIINQLIQDICMNSTPEKGLCFSEDMFNLIKEIKQFNYKYIYLSDRIKPARRYFYLVINEIFKTLKSAYDGENTIDKFEKMKKIYPDVFERFEKWLSNYWNFKRDISYKNDVIFNIKDEKDFSRAIIYYIAGMTDNFAIDEYNKIIGF